MSNTHALYEIFTGKELEVAELIQRRRLQMLVHSCIYYKMDQNIISDAQWSRWGTELADLQNRYPEISQQVGWAEVFEGWDGSSGAFLPLDDPWVVNKALQLLHHQESTYHVNKAVQETTSTKPKKSAKPSVHALF